MQSPNISKCKVCTKHIYNTNVGDLFCKLSPALASSLIPPVSEPPLKLSTGLKCTQQCTEAVLQGEKLEKQAAVVSLDEFKTPHSCQEEELTPRMCTGVLD